jgi:hypothetical protein
MLSITSKLLNVLHACRGFAFIEFTTKQEAKSALEGG